MTEIRDLYRLLQVDPSAEPEVIRAVYLCLAKRYHPDAGSGDAGRMVEFNEAYAVLRDPARRAAYDASRRTSTTPPAPVSVHATAPAGASAGDRTPGDVTLDFGRYAGLTLGHLAHSDPDYLEWLARTPAGRQYRTAIRLLLDAARPPDSLPSRTAPPRRSSRWMRFRGAGASAGP